MRTEFKTLDEAASEWRRTTDIIRRGVMSFLDRVGADLPNITTSRHCGLLAQYVLLVCEGEAKCVVGANLPGSCLKLPAPAREVAESAANDHGCTSVGGGLSRTIICLPASGATRRFPNSVRLARGQIN